MNETRATILVVDDEQLVRWTLRERLGREHDVIEAPNGAQALARYREGVDLVLLDYCLPDMDGMQILAAMREHDPTPPIIMLTAHSSVDMAVQAMRKGSYYYAGKPFRLEDVAELVQQALDATQLRREAAQLGGDEHHAVVGNSVGMIEAKAMIGRIATSPASTVLITGESGTGKDVVARAIHALSARRDAPFMNITCSALPETLLESELFGHERGAFTDAKQAKPGLLEQADGGTVFLDEIGEVSPALQAKLLRFLEDKAFRRVGGTVEIRPDVRVIAATNRDLHAAIAEGTFRSDLYFRLAVIGLHLPPLRDRGEDVELLAGFFVERFNRIFDKNVQGFTPQAVRLLNAHRWPGNVRELRNTIERAVILCEGNTLDQGDIQMLQPRSERERISLPPRGVDLREVERELVVQALERTEGNQTRAAELLGLTRDQVRYRIAKFELGRPSA